MVRPPPNSGDRTIPESVEGTSTALGSRAVVLLDIIGMDGSCGLIGNGKVIHQHCPKIASGEAEPSPSREPEHVRSSTACVVGANCRKGKLRADRRVKSSEAGNAAIPQ